MKEKVKSCKLLSLRDECWNVRRAYISRPFSICVCMCVCNYIYYFVKFINSRESIREKQRNRKKQQQRCWSKQTEAGWGWWWEMGQTEAEGEREQIDSSLKSVKVSFLFWKGQPVSGSWASQLMSQRPLSCFSFPAHSLYKPTQSWSDLLCTSLRPLKIYTGPVIVRCTAVSWLLVQKH